MQKQSRNALCKCGSGKKYKACCLLKNSNTEQHFVTKIKQMVRLNNHGALLNELKNISKLPVNCEQAIDLSGLISQLNNQAIEEIFLKLLLKSNCKPFDANYRLGYLLGNQMRYEEALSFLKAAQNINRSSHDVIKTLAVVYLRMNRLEESRCTLEKLVSTHKDSDASYFLGLTYLKLGEYDKALKTIESIGHENNVYIQRKFLELILYRKLGRDDDAVSLMLKIGKEYKGGSLEVAKAFVQSLTNKNSFLGAVRQASLIANEWNAPFIHYAVLDLLKLLPDKEHFKKELNIGLAKWPNDKNVINSFKMNALYFIDDPHEIVRIHKQDIHANTENTLVEKSVPQKIKIGFFSSDFKQHSVSFFLKPLLDHLDKKNFSTYCYFVDPEFDGVTKAIQEKVSKWRNISSQVGCQAIKELVKNDGIDVAIDLSGYSKGNLLSCFGERLAPCQVTWLGYPATTGISNMDYRLVDYFTDPAPKYDQYSTESLLRFKNNFSVFEPCDQSPDVSKLPLIKNKTVTFGCFTNPAKVNEKTLAVWAQILREMPGSTLILKTEGLDFDFVKESYIKIFSKNGVDKDRLFFIKRAKSIHEHLSYYNYVDIALDTFPYNGATTTCESLWMGVPVATLVGSSHHSRVTYSQLHSVGLNNFAQRDTRALVMELKSLVKDVERLAKIRATLRSVMSASPLMDYESFALEFGTLIKNALVSKVCKQA